MRIAGKRLLASLPPGPRTPPAIQLLQWIWRPVAFMHGCEERYGDTFTVRLAGFPPIVFFSNPDDIRAIFAGDPDILHGGEGSLAVSDIVKRSIFSLDGAAHQRRRKLVAPPFHTERVQASAAIILDATLRSIAAWPEGRPFALHPFMQSITLEVMLSLLFGSGEVAGSAPLAAALGRLIEKLRSPYVALAPAVLDPLGPRMRSWCVRRITHEFDEAVYATIAARRALAGGEAREDILSLLLGARDEDGEPMSDRDLRDELLTFIVAGHETTSTALVWTFRFVLGHSGVRMKIEAELDSAGVVPPIDASRLARLDHLDAAVSESLRHRPVAPMVIRLTKAPATIRGRVFPEGILLSPCIYLAHHRAGVYSDPEAFKPERFFGRKPDPSEWVPFGAGARRCVGASLALLEMRVVLAAVLASVSLRLAPQREPDARLRGLTLAPSTDILFVNDGPRPRTSSRVWTF